MPAMVAKTKGSADAGSWKLAYRRQDEVLVRHEAIGVNFIDIYIREGAYPSRLRKSSLQ